METVNTLQSTINYIKNELKEVYPARETESMAYILLEFVLNYSRIQIQLNKNDKIDHSLFTQIANFTDHFNIF